jgi:hypothetical protein
LLTVKIIFTASLMMSVSAFAQQTADMQPAVASVASALPDAPSSQEVQNPGPGAEPPLPAAEVPSNLQGPIGPVPALLTGGRLTLGDKFRIYVHQAFGPPALVFPALGAGIRMADPPKDYPRDWTDGGGAFGRLYGSALATQTSKRTAKFLTESALHEDPRYLPAAEGAGVAGRIAHAVAFTFVDRSDSGGRELAFANFASAAAGGFVGMAYLPPGFNDISHAGQRMGTEFLGIAIANVSREFEPQWGPIVRKLHIPTIVPAWWDPGRPQHP